jgi:hypothetical protein
MPLVLNAGRKPGKEEGGYQTTLKVPYMMLRCRKKAKKDDSLTISHQALSGPVFS